MKIKSVKILHPIVEFLIANNVILKEKDTIFKLTKTGYKILEAGGIKEYLEKERQKEKQ